MRIQALNTKNQPYFCAIYQPEGVSWNESQKLVVNDIKKTLREPMPEFNGKTAEKFYKSKGLDFEISPHTKKSVCLTAYKRLRKTGAGKDKKYIYSNLIEIGTYDENSKFNVSDIKSGAKNRDEKGIPLIAFFVIMTVTIYAMAFGRFVPKFADKFKPKTELIDGVTNKSKAILPDSTGINAGVNRGK